MFADWLLSKVACIQLSVTDAGVQGSIDVAGELQLTFVRTEDGKQATLMNPPVSAALGIEALDLAMAGGSCGSDPDFRAWNSLGCGAHSSFAWRS